MGKCASKERIGKSLHSRVRTLPAKRPTTIITEEEKQPFFVHDTDSPQLLSARTSVDNGEDGDMLDEIELSRVPADDSKGSTSTIPEYGLSNNFCDAKDDHLPDFPVLDPQGHPLVEYHRDISSATPDLAVSTINYLEISSSVSECLIQREPSLASPLDKSDGGNNTHVLNLGSACRETILAQAIGAVETVSCPLKLDVTARGIASPLDVGNERPRSQVVNLCSTEREADKRDHRETIEAVETVRTLKPTLNSDTTEGDPVLKENAEDISENNSPLKGARVIEIAAPRSVDIDGAATKGPIDAEGSVNDHTLVDNLASLAETELPETGGVTEELEFVGSDEDVPVEPPQFLQAKQDSQEEGLTPTEKSVQSFADINPEESGVESDIALEDKSSLLKQPKTIEASIVQEDSEEIESNFSTIVEPDDDRDATTALEDVSTLCTDEQINYRETAAILEEEGETGKMEGVEVPLEPETDTLLSKWDEKLQEFEVAIGVEVSTKLDPDEENQEVTEIPVLEPTQEGETYNSGNLTRDTAAKELHESDKEDDNMDVTIEEDRETENMVVGLTNKKKWQEFKNEETATSAAQIEESIPLQESIENTVPSEAETNIELEEELLVQLANIEEMQQEATENSDMLQVTRESLREYVEGGVSEIQEPESLYLAHNAKYCEEISKPNTIELEPSQQRAETDRLELHENNTRELQDGSVDNTLPKIQKQSQAEVDEQELIMSQNQENDASELQNGSEQNKQTESQDLARETKNNEGIAGPNTSEMEPSQQTADTNPPNVQENTVSELHDGFVENTPPELPGENQPDMDEQLLVTYQVQEVDDTNELQDGSEPHTSSQPQGDTDVDEQKLVTSQTQEINVSELQNAAEQNAPSNSQCELDELKPVASEILIPIDNAEEGLPVEVTEHGNVQPSDPQGGHSRSIDDTQAEAELQEHASTPTHVLDEDSNSQQTSESIEQDPGATLEHQDSRSSNTVEETEVETNLQESPQTQDAATPIHISDEDSNTQQTSESTKQETGAPVEPRESSSSNTVEETEPETNLHELSETQDAATPIHEDSNTQQTSKTIEQDTDAHSKLQESSSCNTIEETEPESNLQELAETEDATSDNALQQADQKSPERMILTSELQERSTEEPGVELGKAAPTQDAKSIEISKEDSNIQEAKEDGEVAKQGIDEPLELQPISKDLDIKQIEEQQEDAKKDTNIPTEGSSIEQEVEVTEAPPTQDANSNGTLEANEDQEGAKQGLDEPLELQETSRDPNIKDTEEQQDAEKDTVAPVEIQEGSSPERIEMTSNENQDSQMGDDDTEQQETTEGQADIEERKVEGFNELESEKVSSLQATSSDEVATTTNEGDSSTKSETIPAEDGTEPGAT